MGSLNYMFKHISQGILDPKPNARGNYIDQK
jgi:hypothetical protein